MAQGISEDVRSEGATSQPLIPQVAGIPGILYSDNTESWGHAKLSFGTERAEIRILSRR